MVKYLIVGLVALMTSFSAFGEDALDGVNCSEKLGPSGSGAVDGGSGSGEEYSAPSVVSGTHTDMDGEEITTEDTVHQE